MRVDAGARVTDDSLELESNGVVANEAAAVATIVTDGALDSSGLREISMECKQQASAPTALASEWRPSSPSARSSRSPACSSGRACRSSGRFSAVCSADSADGADADAVDRSVDAVDEALEPV